MSNIHDNNCHFDGKRINSGEMICLARNCMICRNGKWEETNKIFVL